MPTGNVHACLANCSHDIMQETELVVTVLLKICGTSVFADTAGIMHAAWKFKAVCMYYIGILSRTRKING
jgi:hypothetical protein